MTLGPYIISLPISTESTGSRHESLLAAVELCRSGLQQYTEAGICLHFEQKMALEPTIIMRITVVKSNIFKQKPYLSTFCGTHI